jgi:hypothetical protein
MLIAEHFLFLNLTRTLKLKTRTFKIKTRTHLKAFYLKYFIISLYKEIEKKIKL